MEAVSRSILIFYVPMLIVLLLVTYIPALTLWLPSRGAEVAVVSDPPGLTTIAPCLPIDRTMVL